MKSGDLSGLQNLVKWIALLTMVVDHVGAIVLPELMWLRVVGRVAFPAFVGLIAYNVSARGVPVMRYLPLVGVFALVSQFPFMLAGFGGLNIFVTLGIGLALWGVRTGELPIWWLATVAAAPVVDYGIFGVLLVVAAAEYVRRRGSLWLGVATFALVGLAQGSIVWGVLALATVLLAVLVAGVVIGCLGRVPAVPRGPRMLFYWFYPVHLVVLVVVGALVQVGRVA